jgi:hypothetical protein
MQIGGARKNPEQLVTAPEYLFLRFCDFQISVFLLSVFLRLPIIFCGFTLPKLRLFLLNCA